HPLVAEEALAEIEGQIIADHQRKAFQRRLVEAELALQILDQLRRQASRAAILAGAVAAAIPSGLAVGALRLLAAAAGDARRGIDGGAPDFRDHAFDRAA